MPASIWSVIRVSSVNNEQVGAVVRFALDNPKKIPFQDFQPVSFTGRDNGHR